MLSDTDMIKIWPAFLYAELEHAKPTFSTITIQLMIEQGKIPKHRSFCGRDLAQAEIEVIRNWHASVDTHRDNIRAQFKTLSGVSALASSGRAGERTVMRRFATVEQV